MCGIAGFTHEFRVRPEGILRRMTGRLTHRGPDQQDGYITQDVALGAVRLRVVDLEGGDQPFRCPDSRAVVVFNGEIYNHREIRSDLERLGHRFISACDTEVALRAFIEWDTGCFSRFRGMFALAFWSENERRLVLARDRMGIKPLYVRRVGRHLAFGSELKALFAHPAVDRRVNAAALANFLALNYVPGCDTLVDGIEKLPSAHFLEWRSGREMLTCYWRPNMNPDAAITRRDAADELDRLLKESVREHLTGDVPIGIWASGGIDSSTLVHYASEQSRSIRTFSVCFDDASCDERAWFREISRRYQTLHEEIELSGGSDLESAVREMAWYSDEPPGDAGALPVWFLSRLSRKYVTVGLSGEGGDELFGGYLTYRADGLARFPRLFPRGVRRAAAGVASSLLPVSDAKLGFEYKLKRWLDGSLLPPDEAHLYWNGGFSERERRRLAPTLAQAAIEHLYSGLPDSSEVGFLNRYLLFDQRYYLQDNLLAKVDRMSMAHSLEVRPPFLDHRIVEFAFRLPEALKIRGREQKIVLKDAMRGKLPDSILRRPKSGLDIPAHNWFRGPLLPLLMDTLSPERLRALPVIDAAEVQRLIADHQARRINAGFQLWGLLTLFLWLRTWDVAYDAEVRLIAGTDTVSVAAV